MAIVERLPPLTARTNAQLAIRGCTYSTYSNQNFCQGVARRRRRKKLYPYICTPWGGGRCTHTHARTQSYTGR